MRIMYIMNRVYTSLQHNDQNRITKPKIPNEQPSTRRLTIGVLFHCTVGVLCSCCWCFWCSVSACVCVRAYSDAHFNAFRMCIMCVCAYSGSDFSPMTKAAAAVAAPATNDHDGTTVTKSFRNKNPNQKRQYCIYTAHQIKHMRMHELFEIFCFIFRFQHFFLVDCCYCFRSAKCLNTMFQFRFYTHTNASVYQILFP